MPGDTPSQDPQTAQHAASRLNNKLREARFNLNNSVDSFHRNYRGPLLIQHGTTEGIINDDISGVADIAVSSDNMTLGNPISAGQMLTKKFSQDFFSVLPFIAWMS